MGALVQDLALRLHLVEQGLHLRLQLLSAPRRRGRRRARLPHPRCLGAVLSHLRFDFGVGHPAFRVGLCSSGFSETSNRGGGSVASVLSPKSFDCMQLTALVSIAFSDSQMLSANSLRPHHEQHSCCYPW